jgi:hypothetical protein
MRTHSDGAVLFNSAQTANLLQQKEFAEPQPGIDAMLDRWDKVVEGFIDEPGVERMGRLKACMRELVEFVWRTALV